MRFAAILLIPAALSAQFISVGVMGGVPLTPEYDVTSNPNPPPPFGRGTYYQNALQRTQPYVVGATIEIHLRRSFFVEVNELYSHSDYDNAMIASTPSSGAGLDEEKHAVTTWETCVLLKYRLLRSHRLSPFVAGGVSFRHDQDRDVQTLLGYVGLVSPVMFEQEPATSTPNMTPPGLTVAGGAELHLLRTRLSLEVRYTRWTGQPGLPALVGANQVPPSVEISNQNTAQLLMGLRW